MMGAHFAQTKKLPPVHLKRFPAKPDIQLPLLSTELLGDVKRRTLQSLPNYNRTREEQALNRYISRRAVLQHHDLDFVASGFNHHEPAPPLTLRQQEVYRSPGDPILESKRDLLDATSAQIADHLFVNAWAPQLAFGETLQVGSGV